jgi:hypothetical protein
LIRASAQAKPTLILRLLTRRFEPLPQAALEQVNALSLDALEALGESLLDFQDINDLNQWLMHHQ